MIKKMGQDLDMAMGGCVLLLNNSGYHDGLRCNAEGLLHVITEKGTSF